MHSFSRHIHIELTSLKETIARQFLTWDLEEEVEGDGRSKDGNDIRAKLRKLLS